MPPTKVAGNSQAESRKGKRYGGRGPGTPNKATKEFRDTVTRLLSDNAENVAKWLGKVAEGTPDVVNAQGVVLMKGSPADPGKALDLLSKLAEFAAPKLGRTELTGKDGGPIEVVSKEQRDAAVLAAKRADS